LSVRTKAEQETILRWDQEERAADLWTSYAPDARRWKKAGYDVHVYTADREGQATSWSARVPVDVIRWRRMQGGEVFRRKGHRKGQLLGVRDDQLVGADA
jgi:hypothetical protein